MAVTLQPGETNVKRIVAAVRQIMQGRLNVTGTFTLAAGVATTTVEAPNCGVGCTVKYTPQTAHAAAEIAGGAMFIAPADVSSGQFIVHHANNAQTDRTFSYVCIG